jgi:hypothetical protein
MGVRDALAGYGVDLRGQFQDDHAALQHLALAYRQAQQSQQLVQYGQQYLQHAPQFQQWLAQQQQAQQAQQQQASEWFKPPEYDARWQSQITRDPTTGQLSAVPGAPPDVVQKYLTWQQHQQDFQQRMARDPIGTLKPGLEQLVDQRAQQIIQQQLGGYQEQSRAQSFLQEHAGWLYARDAQGGVLPNPQTGRPMLGELGQRFYGYVREAESLGLRDVNSQQGYAMRLLRADVAMSQQGQQPAPQQANNQLPGQNAQAQGFLSNAAANRPNAAGSLQPAGAGGAPSASQNSSLPLRERLAQRFREQGYQLSTPIEGNGR